LKISSKTALGGITAAVSIALMFVLSLIPLFTYTVPAAAAILIVPIVIEINKIWALGVYASTAILGILIIPNKEVAIIYAAFFGYYPILKAIIEKRMPFIPEWLLKITVFNVSLFASYYFMIRLMGLEIDEFQTFGVYAIPILLVTGTVAFILYDYSLSLMIKAYLNKIQPIFKKVFK